MYRPLWYRAIVALWGLWITTALVEPAGVLACAMHGGRAVAVWPAAPAASASASGPDAHAHHAPAPLAARAESGDDTHPAGHQCCTCLGDCCTAAPVAAPSVSVALVAPQVRRAPPAPFARAARPDAGRPYALPFANGPPTAVRG